MLRRFPIIALFLLLAASLQLAPAAAGDPQVLVDESHRLDLRVRKPNEMTFTKDTGTVVLQVFLDKKMDKLFYCGEKNTRLAMAPANKAAGRNTENWQRRLLLPVRLFNEKDFGPKSLR